MKDLEFEDIKRLMEIVHDLNLQSMLYSSEYELEKETIGVKDNFIIIFDSAKQKELFDLYDYHMIFENRKNFIIEFNKECDNDNS